MAKVHFANIFGGAGARLHDGQIIPDYPIVMSKVFLIFDVFALGSSQSSFVMRVGSVFGLLG